MRRGPAARPLQSRANASQNVNRDAVRALNVQIRRIAELVPGGLEHEYAFSCECGCGEIVRLSATEYDRRESAWLDGHRKGQEDCSR